MNLQPIYPPRPGYLPAACTGCGGNVDLMNGFAGLDGEPFKAYECARCAGLSLTVGRMHDMQVEAGLRDLRERQP